MRRYVGNRIIISVFVYFLFFVSLEMMENGGLPRSRDEHTGLKRRRWKFSSEFPLSTYYLNNNNSSESKHGDQVREMIVGFQAYVMSPRSPYSEVQEIFNLLNVHMFTCEPL